LTKGKSWSVEDERRLRALVAENKSINEILETMGKSRNSIKSKISVLGLKTQKNPVMPSTGVSLPLELQDELPSIEEKLKVHDAAERALMQPGLSRTEISRLNSIMDGARAYEKMFANFVNYRRIETEVLQLRRELEAHTRSEKDNKSS
jgi:hypothetical protein